MRFKRKRGKKEGRTTTAVNARLVIDLHQSLIISPTAVLFASKTFFVSTIWLWTRSDVRDNYLLLLPRLLLLLASTMRLACLLR